MKPLPKLLLTLGLVSFTLAFAFPVERFFSDSGYLLKRVEAGAPPYYNIAFVPLGRLFAALFGGWLGTERALLVLTAAAVGGAVAATTFVTGRILGTVSESESRVSLVAQLTTGLLLALAPATLFFGAVLEVHAVQLLGASLAIALAWSARTARPGRAWSLLALAMLLAMVTHLSHLLLLPGLGLLAWGSRARGCRFGRRGLPLLGILLAIALVGGLALATADFASWSAHPALQWLGTLIVFGRTFFGGVLERGFFTASEAASYLQVEALAPLGLLALGLPIGLFLALGRKQSEARCFARRALFACLPALLILPQGGVLERGGYFLSYAPLLAVLCGLGVARALRGRERHLLRVAVLLSLLLFVQGALGFEARRSFRAQAPDARLWARAAAAELAPGDSALVSSLARTFALADAAPGSHVRDLARDLALVPRAGRTKTLQRVLAERLGDARYPGDLWIDAELLPGLDGAGFQGAPREWPEAWQARLFELLTEVSPAPTAWVALSVTREAGEPAWSGLAGFDASSAPPAAWIRVRRRP